MAKIGVIARCDTTGLGVQSRNWVRLLDPHKVIVINSEPFNHNEQHPEWYSEYDTETIDGFIWPKDFDRVLNDIDVLLSFEIFYSYELVAEARRRGIKTILQNNWEFTDYLNRPDFPLPDLLVNHSYWNLGKQKQMWPEITEYCPTPLFLDDYVDNFLENLSRKPDKLRLLHVAGRKTYKDRNGTQSLLEAVKKIPQDVEFELVIKAQTAEFQHIHDPRVVIDRDSPSDEKELYRDFDAMILPRRYGGASLPMCEALASGLPVIMTNVDPNNKILPGEWLVPCEKVDAFMARTTIDVYEAQPHDLAKAITKLASMDELPLVEAKSNARSIARHLYCDYAVQEKWALLLKKIGV